MTIGSQLLGNLDAPCLGHAATSLSPLTAGFIGATESFGGIVHQLPCEVFSHGNIKGQIVPLVKSYSPHDFKSRVGQNSPMREIMTPTEFEEMFIARTKVLRKLAGLTAQQMAGLLGIPFERYKKYESRTPLPHALVEQFALITRVPVDYVMTGRRAGRTGLPDVPGPHTLDEWRAERNTA